MIIVMLIMMMDESNAERKTRIAAPNKHKANYAILVVCLHWLGQFLFC